MTDNAMQTTEPETTRQFHIWPGERKLLPNQQPGNSYGIRCLCGSGYLRIMSRSQRIRIQPGEMVMVPGGEIATISGINSMQIEIDVKPL